MRTVQIADDVYTALQRLAVPFEDDINDVLRRVLRDRRTSNGNGALRAASAVDAHAESGEDARSDDTVANVPTGDTVIVHRRVVVNEQHLPQTTFRAAVIGVLRASHEPVAISDVLGRIERQLGDRMTEGDRATSSGDVRWHIQTRNALAQLIHEGTIVPLPNERYQFRNGQR